MFSTVYLSTVFLIFVCLYTRNVGCTVPTATLSPLPEAPEYKASGVEYDDDGMGPLFDFARSFINAALPGGFPAEFINGMYFFLSVQGQSFNYHQMVALLYILGYLYIMFIYIYGAHM